MQTLGCEVDIFPLGDYLEMCQTELMDSYQNQLDIYNAREEAREAAEWRQKMADQQRYENAAKEAHSVRCKARFLLPCSVPQWEDLDLSSQRQLIADAEIVAKNPSITEPELRNLYRERLMAWGDTDHPDLGDSDNESEIIEGMVLEQLKSSLNCN